MTVKYKYLAVFLFGFKNCELIRIHAWYVVFLVNTKSYKNFIFLITINYLYVMLLENKKDSGGDN